MKDREDLNDLLNGAVDVATDQLAKDMEFAPFALAMQTEDGEIFHLEPEEADLARPHDEVVETLQASLKEAVLEGRFRAVVVAADVTLEDDDGEPVTSAIHIAMEHRDGDPVSCLIPYGIDEAGTVELDDLVAEPGESVIFERAAPTDDEPN